MAAKFRFIPVAERFIEGVHARVHKFVDVAPHHGPVHIAWKLVYAQLKRLMVLQPDALPAFARFCEKVRDP
eukprot:5098203-Alexandrium_andersonii.AAC.1